MFNSNSAFCPTQPLLRAKTKKNAAARGCGRVRLSAEPALGIEFLRLVTQLEMQGVASGSIAGNRSDRLAGFDVLSRLYRHTGQVAIDRNVRSVTNEHVLEILPLRKRR